MERSSVRPMNGNSHRFAAVLLKFDFARGFNDRRLVRLAVMGLVVAMVAVSGDLWVHWRFRKINDQLVHERDRLKVAEQKLAHTRLNVVRAREAQVLMNDAEAHGMTVAAWGTRRFSISQAVMSRAALNELLSQIARSSDRLFGAEEFDLASRNQEIGLFDAPSQGDKDVLVSLNGELFFRAIGGK